MEKKIDEKWTDYTRNVVDKYKDWTTEKIREDLSINASPNAVLMSQVQGDFNFSSVIRSANNFNVGNIYYFGNKKFDRRGSCGTHLYMDIRFLESLEEIRALKKKYVFVGLENNHPNTSRLQDFFWPPNACLVLGEEGAGIPPEVISLLDDMVEIPSFGSVRSLNVASAASIALYDYRVKYTGGLYRGNILSSKEK